MYKIFIIAGEASGDILGADLIHNLKLEHPDLLLKAVGGEKMAQENVPSIFPMSQISLMGFFEIIPNLYKIIKLINYTISEIQNFQPDILITIDSPGFCFRVAKKIKSLMPNVKLIHYVAPSVWAYNPKRAKKIAKIYDHLLTLLPFEPQYFIKEGLNATFVGHPLAYKQNIQPHKKEQLSTILCVMPGSRTGEIKRILPIFLETSIILQQKIQNLRVILLTTQKLKSNIEQICADYPIDITIIDNEKLKSEYLSLADFALVKSGTSVLEVAKYMLPMIVAYKVNYLSYFIIKALIKIPYISLINIILNKKIIPEFIQSECNKTNLSEAMMELFNSQDLQQDQRNNFAIAFDKIKRQDAPELSPGRIAARTILSIA